jgi:hypothetical protein
VGFANTLTLAAGAAGFNAAGVVARTVEEQVNFQAAVAAHSHGTGAQDTGIAFVRSKLRTFYAVSDQDVSLLTNSKTGPADTVALKAGEPLVWWDTCPLATPFPTADVTALYVDNNGNSSANVQIYIGKDGH